MAATVAIALASCTAGCAADGEPEIVVSVRTDYAPGLDFQAVEIAPSNGEAQAAAVRSDEDWLNGQVVGTLRPTEVDDVEFRASLLSEGNEIAFRLVRVALDDSLAVTVVVNRACAGISCDEEVPSCLSGVCVVPECIDGNQPECGDALDECAADAACPTPPADCARAACLDGLCYFVASDDPAACGSDEYCDAVLGCLPVAAPRGDRRCEDVRLGTGTGIALTLDGGLELQNGSVSGTFDSAVCDGGLDAVWASFAPLVQAPYNKAIPAGGESGYPSGNASADDLVGLWHFEGSGVIADRAEVPVEGRLARSTASNPEETNLAYEPGVFGTALRFNNSEHISAELDAFPTEWTSSAWVLLDPVEGPHEHHIMAPNGTQLWIEDRALNAGGQTPFGSGDEDIDDGVWHHVALTQSPRGWNLYHNGISRADNTQVPTEGDPTLIIGRIWNGASGSNNLDGLMDEAAFFDRALGASEVLALYTRIALSVRYQVRMCPSPTCDDVPFIGPDGTSATAFTDSGEGSGPPTFDVSALPSGRFFQWRAELAAPRVGLTPTIAGAVVR